MGCHITPTVRRIVESYITGNRSPYTAIYPQGCYAIAYGEDATYLFLWLKVSNDKNYFMQDYKSRHGGGHMILPPGSVDPLSQQKSWFRDSKRDQLLIIPNHVPYDVTDEELMRIMQGRRTTFGENDVQFGRTLGFNFSQ